MKLIVNKTLGTVVLCGFASLYGTALAADAAAGKAVYAAKCRTCHGADGQGNPGMAKVLKTDIKPLTDPAIQGMSEADIKKTITEGKGKMKPVAVSGADLDNVVAYVKSMKK